MALELKRTGDANYPRHLNVLLQGPPKSGKTSFLATAPNVLIGAVEAGLMSIAHKNIAYIDITSTDILKQVHVALANEQLRKQMAQNLGMDDIETFCIDTLDAWQDMMKKEIMKENKRTEMQQQDWGTLKERMATIIKAFVALPINVIFTVHTDSVQDDENKLIYAPALQGGIKNEIAGYVDFSLLAERRPGVNAQGKQAIKYVLKNEGDAKNPHLGNRAAGRVPEICEPDFKLLHDAVFNGITRNDNAAVVPLEVPVQQAPVTQTTAKTAQSAGQAKSNTPAKKDDEADPINANGVTALTKEYKSHNFNIPDDLKKWTLGKGRMVIKYFMAWRADNAATPGSESIDDLISYLKAMEAWNGEAGDTGMKEPAKPEPAATTPEESAAQPEKVQEPVTTAPTPDEEEKAAVKLIEEKLGGVEIGRTFTTDTTCEYEGSEPHKIDDVEVAQLSYNRFKKPTCFKHYKELAAAATK